MRKINLLQILIFLILFSIISVCTLITTPLLFDHFGLGDFRGVILFITGFIVFYIFALLTFRAFLWATPLQAGEIAKDSRQEFVYHVYLLFFLIIFYPIMRSGAVPLPIMRLVYQALGAKLGDNTYSSGIILDPQFVQVGANSLIGQYALLVPHALENERLGHYPISIGNNVTIGAHAVVLAGCTIEDNALVATGAVVTKGTHIANGEVWGGVPAKKLRGGINE
ncbi:MAG: transferase [Proteobacteria bacterium ST_bin11]|nr:MAG: transferase [Proteobacteria bacterium ST_bin11]